MIRPNADTAPDPADNAEARERELDLTPEEALARAIERHKLEQLDDAEVIYKVLLERWPDHPDVLNHMGICSISAASTRPRSPCSAIPSRSRRMPPASGTTSATC